jgi:hypothetical protein
VSKVNSNFFTNLLLFGHFSTCLDNILNFIVYCSTVVIRDYFFWFLHVKYFDLAASFAYSRVRKLITQGSSACLVYLSLVGLADFHDMK